MRTWSGAVHVPVILALADVASKHSKKRPVVQSDLTADLWVICGRRNAVQNHKLAKVLKQLRHELLSGIREQLLRWPVFENAGLAQSGNNVLQGSWL